MDVKIKNKLKENRLLINLIRQIDEELYEEGYNVELDTLIMRFVEAIDTNYDNIYQCILNDMDLL